MRIANLLTGSGNDRYPGMQVPQAVLPADVEVEPIETGVYVEPRGAAACTLLGATLAAAAVRAERDGFDGAFMNTTSDYGLEEIRSLVGIPVVGCGEAAMKVATSLGERFAIVQVWPEWARQLDESVLAAVGVADRCCAIRNVAATGEEDDIHVAMFEGAADPRKQMLNRILAAANAAIEEDGAEVIMLGCTCMSSIASELSAMVDVPVVDPLVAGYLAAEQLVRSGLRPVPATDPELTARLASMFEAIGAGLDEGEGNQLESCEVCVVAQPAAPV
ncbi:MAG: aspartate/glutamate racemase family protein [Actinobacteria bacterium]|nr:aspartate/glutamate racemase family protein [Actinomycetota bacterium]